MLWQSPRPILITAAFYNGHSLHMAYEFKLTLKHIEVSLNKGQITIKTFYSFFLVGQVERQIVLVCTEAFTGITIRLFLIIR